MRTLLFLYILFSFCLSHSQRDVTVPDDTTTAVAQTAKTHLYCNCGTGLYVLLENPENQTEIDAGRVRGKSACRSIFPSYGESETPANQRRQPSVSCEIKPKNQFFCLYNFFNSGQDESGQPIQETGWAQEQSSPNLTERHRAELTQQDPSTSHLIRCYSYDDPAGLPVTEAYNEEVANREGGGAPDPQWLERVVGSMFRQACSRDLSGECGRPWGRTNATANDKMRCMHDRRHRLSDSCKQFFYP